MEARTRNLTEAAAAVVYFIFLFQFYFHDLIASFKLVEKKQN